MMSGKHSRVSRVAIAAAVVWFVAGSVSAVLLLRPSNPYWLVIPGVVLAFVVPDIQGPGWPGFLSSSLVRIADTALVASLAWALGRYEQDIAGSAAAASLLAAALLSSYVRIRATSLSITFPEQPWLQYERGVRLGLIAAGLVRGLVPMLWVATALSLLVAAVRSSAVWREASRG